MSQKIYRPAPSGTTLVVSCWLSGGSRRETTSKKLPKARCRVSFARILTWVSLITNNRQLTTKVVPDGAGRYIFCDTFRYQGFTSQVPSFSRGMPPSGVRTFLWRETFQPAIACHIADPTIEEGRDPAPSKSAPFALGVLGAGLFLQHGANRYSLLTFRMKLVKDVLVSRSDFPGVFGGILKEKSLARRGKTNIVHAPPRLAE